MDAITVVSLVDESNHIPIQFMWNTVCNLVYQEETGVQCIRQQLNKDERTFLNQINPLAILYHKFLILCEKCHSRLEPGQYDNATTWFLEIVCEEYQHCLSTHSVILGGKDKGSKNFYHIFGELKKASNPFKNEDRPHLSLLFDEALKRRNKEPGFLKKYWEPMLAAFKKFMESFKTEDWAALSYKSGVLCQRHGRGNAFIPLVQQNTQESFLKVKRNRSLKKAETDN
ncbi:hypothetical protein ACEYW6_35820 [Nostoc sp. UIC 10607]|uniref:hypothetical protein n=1 Tax=Nostoc sp. UIC 10607 TaxID=3045935 RepID=UPI0039A21EC6